MKKTYTKHLSLSLTALLLAANAWAGNYTASVSGNYSNPATWGGTTMADVPPVNVGVNDIYINSGVTVTLDRNVELTNMSSIFQLLGTAKITSTTNNYIALRAGNFLTSNTSNIEIDSIFVGKNFMMNNHTGTVKVNKLELSEAPMFLDINDLTVNETLTLSGAGASTLTGNGGSIKFATGGSTTPTIVFNGGNLTLGLGGLINLNNSYAVLYRDASRIINSNNWELMNPNVKEVGVDIGSGNTMSLNASLNATFVLDLISGKLNLNGNDLMISGSGEIYSSGGLLASNSSSSITITSTAADIGDVEFDPANNTVNDITMNTGISDATLFIDANVVVNGQLDLQNGVIIMDGTELKIAGGMLNGGSAKSYIATMNGGKLTMDIAANGTQMYPVGSIQAYSPAKITAKNGTAFTQLGIGVSEEVMSMGTTGTDWSTTKPMVDAAWTLSHGTTTGLEFDLELSWDPILEVNGFDKNKYFISNYTGGKWDNSSENTATATGSLNTGMRTGAKEMGVYTVFDNKTLGVEDVKGNTAVTAFPNPATSHLNFTLSNTAPLEATIFDVQGRMVMQTEVSITRSRININDLKAGMYYLQLNGDNVNATTKFVKQ